nr:hypothetical protein [Tanacetum cinerariifolium]
KPKRKDTQVPQPSSPTESIIDEAVHKELGDRLVRAATTASSLKAEQDSGNITKTQSKKTPNEPSSQETNLGGGPRVESSDNEESLGEDVSKQARKINSIDTNEDITLVSVQDDTDKEMFDVYTLVGDEVFVARQNKNVVEEVVDAAQVSIATTTVTITTKEITLAQELKALKTSKPKVKGNVFQERTVKSKKKDQIRLDEEDAKKLQAEFNEEERLAREKAEKEERANIALIEE